MTRHAARRIFAACAVGLAAALAAPPARAEPPRDPVLVELFTSQGCSSCPVANAALGRIAREPNAIALTYAVNYWDYLGWRDTFAKPEFTARQKWYARRFHRGVYTPQMVVNGAAHKGALGPEELRRLDAGARMAGGARIAARRHDGRAAITISGAPPGKTGEVWLAQYQPGPAYVAVSRGENAGARVPHFNVVTGLSKLGAWGGGAMRYDAACAPACAIIVQGENGRVLAASLAH